LSCSGGGTRGGDDHNRKRETGREEDQLRTKQATKSVTPPHKERKDGRGDAITEGRGEGGKGLEDRRNDNRNSLKIRSKKIKERWGAKQKQEGGRKVKKFHQKKERNDAMGRVQLLQQKGKGFHENKGQKGGHKDKKKIHYPDKRKGGK